MNLCKVMQVQAKSMKENWSFTSGLGVHGNFKSTNNQSDDGEEFLLNPPWVWPQKL